MPETMTPEQTFATMVAEGDIVLDKLDECARTTPDEVFIHYGEDDIKLTFAEFKARTDAFNTSMTEAIPGPDV